MCRLNLFLEGSGVDFFQRRRGFHLHRHRCRHRRLPRPYSQPFHRFRGCWFRLSPPPLLHQRLLGMLLSCRINLVELTSREFDSGRDAFRRPARLLQNCRCSQRPEAAGPAWCRHLLQGGRNCRSTSAAVPA